MAADPYSTLLLGVATRLRDTGGPFAQSDQVKVWAEEALEQYAPSQELLDELSRTVPIALVCDGGQRVDDAGRDSDGDREVSRVRIWVAGYGPTPTAAVTGDGDEYWGSLALAHYVRTRLGDRDWSITGWETAEWESNEPVKAPNANRALSVVTVVFARHVDL